MYVVFKVCESNSCLNKTGVYCIINMLLYFATVAQLVEYDLAKVGVAGSSPVCRLVEESEKPYKSRLLIFVGVDSFEDS